MKTTFIVAFELDQKWEQVALEIPIDAIPEKFVPGSAKWVKRAVAWYRETQPSAGVVYVGVLEAGTAA